MPSVRYSVYVGNTVLASTIEEYCEDNDLEDSAFFRQAAEAKLAREGYL